MSQKTKIILIIAAIALVLCTCAVICVGIFVYIGGSLSKEASEIKESVILDLCNSHGEFDDSDYRAWFTESYRNTVPHTDAKTAVSDAFPSDYDCKELETGNLLDLLLSGQSMSISTTTTGSTAEFSYPKDENETVTIELRKVGTEWEIDAITVTRRSG